MTSVNEFYSGKNVFITGGSGFIGKALIEKLLRSCSDIIKIYVLLRSKKNFTQEERLKKIFDDAIFDGLKKQNNLEWKRKLISIPGDLSQINLGVSEENRRMLIENVNIIIHTGASIKFNDPLSEAILLNTRGTREMCNLALEIKRLDIFVHVSTTYCNLDHKILEERIYPPIANWKQTIELAENIDPVTLSIISKKILHHYPNTYTFTKHLSEHVVYDMCNQKIPTVIMRPPAVISSLEEPFVGWTDNFNGPVGFIAASSKGIIRVFLTDPKRRICYAPVDQVVKVILSVVYTKVVTIPKQDAMMLDVYNVASKFIEPKSFEEITKDALDLMLIERKYPIKNMIWYPNCVLTKSSSYYYILVILLHVLPAIFIDTLLKLLGKKAILFKIQRKLYIANKAIAYFFMRNWIFVHDKTDLLKNAIPIENHKDFLPVENAPTKTYLIEAATKAKELLLKEHANESDFKQNDRMKILYYVSKFIIYLLLAYLFYKQLLG